MTELQFNKQQEQKQQDGEEEKKRNSQSQRKEAQKLGVEKLAKISRKAFKTTGRGLERWLFG